MLTVSAKTLGSKRPLFADFSVPLPTIINTSDHSHTLRSMIPHIVRHEVDAFRTRQAERRLLKVLTTKEIDAALEKGKVFSGGSELDQKVDTDAAIQAALEAFVDGLYLVVVDETEIKSLDAVIPLTESSRLTFIRLSLLAGG